LGPNPAHKIGLGDDCAFLVGVKKVSFPMGSSSDDVAVVELAADVECSDHVSPIWDRFYEICFRTNLFGQIFTR
jgi:hypothetical protein